MVAKSSSWVEETSVRCSPASCPREGRLNSHQGCSVEWSSLGFLLSWQQQQWGDWLPEGVHKCMLWARQHTTLTGQGGEKGERTCVREEGGGQQECVCEAGETSYRVTS